VKAVILAGGKGTRGKPYTDYFPKAMIPVNGIPLIQRVAEYISAEPSIQEIIVIADFGGLGAQIKRFFEGQEICKKMRFVQDSQSGTGGDLVHAADLLGDTGEFILWFVDNFCALDIGAMKRQFDAQEGAVCIAVRNKRREETGFAKVADGRITEFKEKPVMSLPHPECLGIYMMDAGILKDLKSAGKKKFNLSVDVLEGMARDSQVSAYDIGDAEWLDVESPVVIERNQESVDRIIEQMEP